jgi:hypothetical protein
MKNIKLSSELMKIRSLSANRIFFKNASFHNDQAYEVVNDSRSSTGRALRVTCLHADLCGDGAPTKDIVLYELERGGIIGDLIR